MPEIKLKDRNGNDVTFDPEIICVRDADDSLVQFTYGTGDIPAVLQDKTITENGTYTADSGYDGLGSVTVEVAGGGDLEFLETPITKEGKFKATSATGNITINHGLGVLPDCVVISGVTQANNTMCYLCGFRNGLPYAIYKQEYIRNSTTSGGLLRSGLSYYIDDKDVQWGAIGNCDESSFNVGGMMCQFDTSIEYTWQVIRHTAY